MIDYIAPIWTPRAGASTPMQAESAPSVAVIIAAFNAAETIERAVRSALVQNETAEVCVIDDASRDGTALVVEQLAGEDERVKLIRLEENAGPAAARNTGIAATTSPWIAILDADDYFLEGRLGRMLARGAKADVVADEIIRVEGDATPEAPCASIGPAQILTFRDFVAGNLGEGGHGRDLGFMKPIMRRAFLCRFALSYRADMRLGEDYEFYARVLAKGARFAVGTATGYVSVNRPGSISNAHSIEDLQKLRDCDAALSRLIGLSLEDRAALERHASHVDQRLQWRKLIEAVKAHDWLAAAATFRSWDVTGFLMARLAEQAWLRWVKKQAPARA